MDTKEGGQESRYTKKGIQESLDTKEGGQEMDKEVEEETHNRREKLSFQNFKKGPLSHFV